MEGSAPLCCFPRSLQPVSICFARCDQRELCPDGCADGGSAPAIPLSAPDRTRSDGRHLRRDRRGSRPKGRCQAARRALRARRRHQGAVQTRGPGRGAALGPARGRDDLRRRRVGGAAVHRHGAPRRRVARAAHPTGRRAASRAGARVARAGSDGSRRSARPRDRPSRRQAGEPAPERARRGAGGGFRDRERGRAPLADADRHGARHRRLPLARASSRSPLGPGERPLRARGRRLRAAQRPPALRARVDDRRGCGARQCADSVDRRVLQEPPARGRPRLPARAGEGSGGPLRLGSRVRRRSPPRAPRRSGDDSASRPGRAGAGEAAFGASLPRSGRVACARRRDRCRGRRPRLGWRRLTGAPGRDAHGRRTRRDDDRSADGHAADDRPRSTAATPRRPRRWAATGTRSTTAGTR